MLSFVCLLQFIILVYVPGSTLNVIENTSGSLVSNNFNKKTLIRTTTTPLSSLSTSLPSDLSNEFFTTIESIKLLKTKPSFTYNHQQSSHSLNVNRNYSSLDEKTTKQRKSITTSTILRAKQSFTTIPPIPIVIQKYPLLVNSYPTKITTIEYLTTFPNEFKGSFSNNRGGKSLVGTDFPNIIIPTTSKTIKTTTLSTPIGTRTVKITKKFYESSLSSSIAPTLSLSSPSTLIEDGYINITSQAGTHAYLPCNVKQLVKKPVSWIRVRDGHILTVDQTTFIADQRFQSIYTQNTERWSLQIKYVQIKDAGAYECQVSTEPKTSSLVRLNIVEPKTEMIGEMNRHVKAGSRVIVRCIISEALEPPIFVNWFFNDKQIFLVNQNGWRTEVDRMTLPTSNYSENHTTIASLIIPSVRKKDSGNYTCKPSNSESITVVLHVLSGDYSASAITSGSSSSKQNQFNINRIQQQIIIVISLISFHLQALIEV